MLISNSFSPTHLVSSSIFSSLFLGICNGDRVAEAIVQTCVSSSPVIGLRFNSIRIDYNAVTTLPVVSRTIKTSPCAVRVDIYNGKCFSFDRSSLISIV